MEGITGLAVQKFQAVERAQHRMERAEAELNEVVGRIPEADMEEYVRITERVAIIQRSRCRVCARADRRTSLANALEAVI